MSTNENRTTVDLGQIAPQDFAAYDRCLDEGRRAYLAGLGVDANLYPRGTDKWDWWREGYNQ